jgi:hypothetical protein
MRTFKNSLLVLIGLCIGGNWLHAAETSSDIVDLPTFEVREDRILAPLEKWHYVSIPGFEILSNVSAGATKRFVKDFYLLQQVARFVLPNANSTNIVPTYVVLCGRGKAFDHFTPPELRTDEPARGLYFNDAERTAIVVDFSPALSGDDDGGGADPYRTFYGSYFRTLIKRELGPLAPAWMEEGLVRLYSTVNFTSGWIEFAKVPDTGFGFSGARYAGDLDVTRFASQQGFGMASWSPMGSTSGGLTRTGGRALIPMNKFFTLSPSYLGAYTRSQFSDQAYLFAHMCLYGKSKTQQRGYYQLAQKATQGPITEQIFQECFGRSFTAFGASMRGYSDGGRYNTAVLTEKQGLRLTPPPEFVVRMGTDAESGRIAGEVLRLAGRRNDALNRLIAPYIRGDRSPDLLAALGLAEAWAEQPERAQKFLEAAIAAKTTRTRAYAELGNLRFKAVKSRAASENRPLSEAECRSVIEVLEAGLKHPPALVELYNNLAMVWIENPARPTPEQYTMLVRCVRQNPKNLMLAHNVAAAGIQHGYLEESRPLVAHGLRYASSERARAAFSKLNSFLPAKADSTPETVKPASTSTATTPSARTGS